MAISSTSSLTSTLTRIGLWFGSALLAVTFFSELFALFLSSGGPIFFIFRFTGIFAFPVACLYLPFVIALKDAEERRIWTILPAGLLIGPASLLLWCIVVQRTGIDPDAWKGDPLTGMGCLAGMVYALIVGFLTTFLYVIALKVLYRLTTTAKERVARS